LTSTSNVSAARRSGRRLRVMLHTLDMPVTDFLTAVAALIASGKTPRLFSSLLNASTPRGPRLMRNPAQALPSMTEMRRGVSMLSLAMCFSPKEGASPEGDAVMSSLRGDRVREFATLLADRWHYGLIPDFGHADSPAEVRALPRRPAPPGRGHFLNSDARCLLSLSRLPCGC